MKKLNSVNIVWKEGGFYVSKSLTNSISSFGLTKNEAIENLNEALSLYYEDEQNILDNLSKIVSPELFTSEIAYA